MINMLRLDFRVSKICVSILVTLQKILFHCCVLEHISIWFCYRQYAFYFHQYVSVALQYACSQYVAIVFQYVDLFCANMLGFLQYEACSESIETTLILNK